MNFTCMMIDEGTFSMLRAMDIEMMMNNILIDYEYVSFSYFEQLRKKQYPVAVITFDIKDRHIMTAKENLFSSEQWFSIQHPEIGTAYLYQAISETMNMVMYYKELPDIVPQEYTWRW